MRKTTLTREFLLCLLFNACAFGPEPTIELLALPTESGDTIHVRTVYWGINGQHREVIISNRLLDADSEYDLRSDIKYSGTSPILLKQQGDTLLVFTYSHVLSTVPVFQYKSLAVRQFGLDGREMSALQDSADSSFIRIDP